MAVLKTSLILFFFVTVIISIRAQSPEVLIRITFNEGMDTIGFSNPNNFRWTRGLQTLDVELVDPTSAILKVTRPEVYIWYTLKVSNVFDLSGNLINREKDTIGCYWKTVPMPVELSSFTAKFDKDKVLLKWITETEVNNYGFEIERRVNSENWQKIGFVAGHGNSNSQKHYSFVDGHLIGGKSFYYRLKQIDNDGEYEYSGIIEVENIPRKFALYQNYPNPFNPITKIRYQLPLQTKAEIKIFDLTGSEVTTLLDDDIDSGVFEVEFNGQGLSSGIYFYRLKAGDFVETKKMILMK